MQPVAGLPELQLAKAQSDVSLLRGYSVIPVFACTHTSYQHMSHQATAQYL